MWSPQFLEVLALQLMGLVLYRINPSRSTPSLIIKYRHGTTNNISSVDMVKPPITVRAIGLQFRTRSDFRASGTIDKMVVKAVIRIGRNYEPLLLL